MLQQTVEITYTIPVQNYTNIYLSKVEIKILIHFFFNCYCYIKIKYKSFGVMSLFLLWCKQIKFL